MFSFLSFLSLTHEDRRTDAKNEWSKREEDGNEKEEKSLKFHARVLSLSLSDVVAPSKLQEPRKKK
jgi:hypothetical protein